MNELIARAKSIQVMYEELELQKYGRNWSREEIALGFVGDVGKLMQLIQAKEGIRSIDNVQDKLAHELSDCLWSIVVLADKYGIDIEKSFMETMDEIEGRIKS